MTVSVVNNALSGFHSTPETEKILFIYKDYMILEIKVELVGPSRWLGLPRNTLEELHTPLNIIIYTLCVLLKFNGTGFNANNEL